MGVLAPEVGDELSPPYPWPEVEKVGAKIQMFKFFFFIIYLFLDMHQSQDFLKMVLDMS